MNTTHRGFTLIEMVIALGVGLVVIFLAMAGLRLTAQTLALTRQLALQNDLMRSGLLTALEDRDFWTLYDDPDDAANQGLRQTSVMPAEPMGSYRKFGIDPWDVSSGLSYRDAAYTVPVNNGLRSSAFGQENLILGRPFSPLSQVPLPLTNGYDLSETTRSGAQLMPYARNVSTWGVRAASAHPGRAFEEPWVVRPIDDASPIGLEHQRTLIPLAQLEDDDFVAAIDMDRGLDAARPYQANDPRRWYRGYLPETPHSDKRFGRYGLCANLWKQPVLGWGQDAREPYGLSPAATPEFQSVTGPYGPYSASGLPCQGGAFDGYNWNLAPDNRIRTRTFTWQSNQVVFLQDALGNIGMGDYLPAGTILHTYGARALTTGGPWTGAYVGTLQDGVAASPRTAFAPVTNASKPDANMARIDERSDCRWAGSGTRYGDFWTLIYNTANGWTTGATGLQNLTAAQATRKPLSTRSMWMLLPDSPFSGGRINGFALDYSRQQDSFLSDDTTRRTPNTDLDPRLLTLYQHMPWWGQENDDTEFVQSFNRGFLTRPLLTRKPPDWPDTSIAVGTWWNGRLRTMYRVRWSDPVSGEVQGLSIASLGTTLRGARQQRKPTGGWAAWYGPGDARNSPTLDSPP